MKLPQFDRDFIMKWERNHYQCQSACADESEYQKIIKAVQTDIAKANTISEHTLKRILKWKDKQERVKAKVNWGQYHATYTPRFRLIIADSIADHHKLFILIWDKSQLSKKLPVASGVLDNIHGKAHGFGVPVASTVLHFIFPDRFPIIDIRTAESLYLACKIKAPDRQDHRYDSFRSALLAIASATGCTLHQIDTALFAYHRDVIQPRMNEVWKTWIAEMVGNETPLNLTLDAQLELRRKILDDLKKDS